MHMPVWATHALAVDNLIKVSTCLHSAGGGPDQGLSSIAIYCFYSNIYNYCTVCTGTSNNVVQRSYLGTRMPARSSE